jgi:hypothetical protein
MIRNGTTITKTRTRATEVVGMEEGITEEEMATTTKIKINSSSRIITLTVPVETLTKKTSLTVVTTLTTQTIETKVDTTATTHTLERAATTTKTIMMKTFTATNKTSPRSQLRSSCKATLGGSLG